MDRAPVDRTLSAQQRATLAALIANPIYELVPVAGVEQAAAALPPRAPVTVTASPRQGIGATLDAAESLAAQGHDVCPHLAARSIRDRVHLADIVARLRSAGIHKAFVVGGDGAWVIGLDSRHAPRIDFSGASVRSLGPAGLWVRSPPR